MLRTKNFLCTINHCNLVRFTIISPYMLVISSQLAYFNTRFTLIYYPQKQNDHGICLLENIHWLSTHCVTKLTFLAFVYGNCMVWLSQPPSLILSCASLSGLLCTHLSFCLLLCFYSCWNCLLFTFYITVLSSSSASQVKFSLVSILIAQLLLLVAFKNTFTHFVVKLAHLPW